MNKCTVRRIDVRKLGTQVAIFVTLGDKYEAAVLYDDIATSLAEGHTVGLRAYPLKEKA